jgi:voltage-gated potassium channel Kch
MFASIVLGLLVVAPLVAAGVLSRAPFDAFFTLILVSGVVTVSSRRWVAVAVSAVVAVTLAVRWMKYVLPSLTIDLWDQALSILALSIFVGLVLVLVFREGPITFHRILGAIVVYILAGLVFMNAYQLMFLLRPASFQFAGGTTTPDQMAHGLAFFSFVTLTTVGYGDILPIHPVARTLAMTEALIGQLYPAILIGRLVSLQIGSSKQA